MKFHYKFNVQSNILLGMSGLPFLALHARNETTTSLHRHHSIHRRYSWWQVSQSQNRNKSKKHSWMFKMITIPDEPKPVWMWPNLSDCTELSSSPGVHCQVWCPPQPHPSPHATLHHLDQILVLAAKLQCPAGATHRWRYQCTVTRSAGQGLEKVGILKVEHALLQRNRVVLCHHVYK